MLEIIPFIVSIIILIISHIMIKDAYFRLTENSIRLLRIKQCNIAGLALKLVTIIIAWWSTMLLLMRSSLEDEQTVWYLISLLFETALTVVVVLLHTRYINKVNFIKQEAIESAICYCVNCGMGNPPGTEFCTQCGQPIKNIREE